MNELEKFGNIPIDNAVLSDITGNYNFPRNKVASMEKRGDIIRLKKGLYVVSDKISHKQISRELIANHLYGVSYISLETALSHYGLIPEKVFAIRSITTKRAKQFENAFGRFEYITMPTDYFSIGIRQQIVDNEYAYLIATPEKALCDLIIATPSVRIQSVKAMQAYLEDDLRIDFSAVENIDLDVIGQCAEVGRKKGELGLLLEFLECDLTRK
ncbi:type IV toxin-antitoxin system AbiEi family antitoxin domain-containing protein [Viscerimonas tarda]